MAASTIGATLTDVRVARGLSQAELAAAAGISQGLLSKLENETIQLDRERAAALADQLDVRPELFFGARTPSMRIFHRKQASLPITADKRVRAEAGLLQAQLTHALGEQLPELRLRRRPLPEDKYYTPADIARQVRDDLNIPAGPIEDIVDVLERAGVLVLPHDMKSLKVDAIALWPDAGAPIVFLADHAPVDRQRFTLAHELGHAVMHDVPASEQEQEADAFASEFLMPKLVIRDELTDLTMDKLVALKKRWRVSMAALARRARDLGQMTDAQYRSFNIRMSASGMKTREPVELPANRPALIRRLLRDRVAETGTVEAVADSAWMSSEELQTRFLEAS
jgi:Zn-dependent peptidase ImmA (M78 family)/DNA-binding XRE family transcriptional regulator